MSIFQKQTIQEKYSNLKKVFEKMLNPKKQKSLPQFVLQPYRNKKTLRDIDLR